MNPLFAFRLWFEGCSCYLYVWIHREEECVRHTGLGQDVKAKRGRGRCLQGTKMSVGESDSSFSADWVGEGKAMPQLISKVVRKHLLRTTTLCTCLWQQLPAALWGWVHQLGSSSCAERSHSICHSLRRPQAQATASGRPCHLLGHPCSAAAGSITQTSSPRRPGQLPLFLYYSLVLPANKTVNPEDGLCHTKGKGQCDLHVIHPPLLWQRCILARQSRLDRGSKWRITHSSYKNKYITSEHAAAHTLWVLCYLTLSSNGLH